MSYHIILQKPMFFKTDCFSHHLYVQGVTSSFFLEERNLRVLLLLLFVLGLQAVCHA